MKKIVRKNILKIKPYVPGRPIEEVQRELGLSDVVKLASNENPFGPSPMVLDTIREKSKDINRYPDGNCFYLRQELSRRLSVAANQLIFGNGSDEIIVMATRAFLEKGDEVVAARPSFLIYEIASQLADAKVKFVPLKNFRYDLQGMKKAVTKKTKIIFIGNPDNPAGTYINQDQVKDFLASIRKDVLVFFDEAYYEFVSRRDYPYTIALLKSYKNILITRTFSKIYGLAGLRIGYGIANPEMIDLLERVRDPFNVNSLAQAAALAALKDESYYRRMLALIEGQRGYLYDSLRSLKLSFIDTVTNFIPINVKKDASEFARKLMKKGVIVRDMGAWGLKTYIRVTIGNEEENRKFINALKEIK